jgi:uncharacterized protein YcbK (DUF882 family)
VPGLWPAFVNVANDALAGRNVRVTSWFRTVAENRALPAAHPQSQHLIGTAFDVNGPDRDQVAADLQRGGFIIVRGYRDGHVHAQTWPAGVAARAGLLRAAGVG